MSDNDPFEWTEEDKVGAWECDGCHLRGTFDEVDAHLVDHSLWPSGEFKDVEDVTCWGAMKVGSQSHTDYWDKGIHPMTTLMGRVEVIHDSMITDAMEENL